MRLRPFDSPKQRMQGMQSVTPIRVEQHGTTPKSSQLLEGLRVVELGDRIGVGACGQLLAHLGATVIFVEPKAMRTSAKWRQRATMAAGKLSLVADERDAAPVLDVAIRSADVVLLSTDLSSRDMAVWEGDRSSSQIVCDITAFGHRGPLAGHGYSEALVQAVAGIAETTGNRNGLPTVSGAPFLEMESAVYATAAILAALQARRQGGAGQRIEIAIYDVAINALLTFIPLEVIGSSGTRNGNRHPTLAPWNSYRAKDGWVLICGPTNDLWRRLCVAMGNEELSRDVRFATPTARFENVEELDTIISAWVAAQSASQCIETVSANGIPVSSIVGTQELAAEPNLRHRSMVRELNDPLTKAPVLVSGSPFRVVGESATGGIAIPAPDQDRAVIERQGATGATARKVAGDVASDKRALAGVRVVEIGMNTVAPLATRHLAALGADVIKVEPPSGDTNRVNTPIRENGEGYHFAMSNTDKRGLVLDLKQPGDRDTLWRLLETADIVIENLRPNAVARLGLGSEDVRRRLPHLIYCSVNGFGYDTVYPGRPALDTVIQAMSGAMGVTLVDGVPTKAGISISDQLGGQFGLVSVLAALHYRARTGYGVSFDLAMQDGTAWATQMTWNGSAAPPFDVCRARDGYVVIEGEDALARGCALASDHGLTRNALSDLINRDCPGSAAPVLTVAEVMAHPQTQIRRLLKDVPSADGSTWFVIDSPLKLRSMPAETRSAMPRLGFLDPALAAELGLDVQASPVVRSALEASA